MLPLRREDSCLGLMDSARVFERIKRDGAMVKTQWIP